MVYKILFGHTKLNPRTFFPMRQSNTRGAVFKIVLPPTRVSLKTNFFAYRAGSDFTRLAKFYEIPPRFSSFKRAVGKFLK